MISRKALTQTGGSDAGALSQDDVFDALATALERRFGPCERIETHMSTLFITPQLVFKAIKARRHPFADMSILAQRERACRAEFDTNRLIAPNLYVALQGLHRDPSGALNIDAAEDAPAIEWIIIMRRFPDDALFADLAAHDALTAARVDDAVDQIIAFHRLQPPVMDPSAASDYTAILRDLRKTVRDAADDQIDSMEKLFGELDRTFETNAGLREERRAAGWVRRGHGDFHLRNICVFENRVTPFDALAFDERLATSDVLYDFSFFLMDLRASGLAALANRALNRFWDGFAQNESALALLPGFMALRAAVRMAVAVEAGDDREAGRYLALALELLAPISPRLLVVGGLSGTGKSSVARALAPLLPGCAGARVLSADMLRKCEAGIAPLSPLPASAYTPEARGAVYRMLAAHVRDALDAGSAVVADATFQSAEHRHAIIAAAAPHPATGVWLHLPAPQRLGRISRRGPDVSDISMPDAEAQREPDARELDWPVINAARPVEDIAAAIRKDIERP